MRQTEEKNLQAFQNDVNGSIIDPLNIYADLVIIAFRYVIPLKK